MENKPQGSDRARELLAEIEQQVGAMASEDDWRAYLDTAARFPTYSANNQLLIALSRPDASRVAGYGKWREMGRHVRRGEKGIPILAPVTRRVPVAHEESDTDDGATDARQPQRRLVGFRVAHVFDVAQTDGDPLPAHPPVELLEGGAPDALRASLEEQVRDAGFTLSYVKPDRLAESGCPGANGVTRYDTREVWVRGDVEPAQRAKTLAHELAHVQLHGPDTQRPPRSVIEVEAESVAYVVCRQAGLDPSGYSIGYVTSWSGGDPAVVRSVADRVSRTSGPIVAEHDRYVALATEHLADVGPERDDAELGEPGPSRRPRRPAPEPAGVGIDL